ncbi:MAG: dioxygenase [Deltaproteobacteria bacterium]|nr:MAG: dioxygenase [Deltaproteobacteria bacterium]
MESLDPPAGDALPTLYIPHGGGPCFFMEWTMGPPDTWERMRAWLQGLGQRLANARALLVVSAHWEEPVVTVQTGARPPLYFDYYGFPPHTYALTWPAPGAPDVARRAVALLQDAGFATATDPDRGFDHGVFVPLKVAVPDARIPTFQVSLRQGLDAPEHLAIGRALAPLRREGVRIIGSGMSFHNMGALMQGGGPRALQASRRFDAWLETVCAAPAPRRRAALANWQQAPDARFCHPREEHLLPLMVVAGAAGDDPGRVPFRDRVMGVEVAAVEFAPPPAPTHRAPPGAGDPDLDLAWSDPAAFRSSRRGPRPA